jgi:hypothetical protein
MEILKLMKNSTMIKINNKWRNNFKFQNLLYKIKKANQPVVEENIFI